VTNEHRGAIPAQDRSRLGQTAYKRAGPLRLRSWAYTRRASRAFQFASRDEDLGGIGEAELAVLCLRRLSPDFYERFNQERLI
jgi:hypothetical protein